MSESLLTVLKFCFLALLYLFLARVVWVVAKELRSERVPTAAGPAAPVATPPAAAAPSRGSRRGGSAVLRVVASGPYEGAEFPLDDEMTVGRAPGCGVVLVDDTFVSQVHARVFRRGRDVMVEDLGSTNGTLVNGERIAKATRLRKGDTVQFGETVAQVQR
jgi:hypothetical protein